MGTLFAGQPPVGFGVGAAEGVVAADGVVGAACVASPEADGVPGAAGPGPLQPASESPSRATARDGTIDRVRTMRSYCRVTPRRHVAAPAGEVAVGDVSEADDRPDLLRERRKPRILIDHGAPQDRGIALG
jgi:hypothetical protein